MRLEDSVGKLGIHPLQRAVPALLLLPTGVADDIVEEYCRIRKELALSSLLEFSELALDCFGTDSLREPTETDLWRIISINEGRGSLEFYVSYTSITSHGVTSPWGWRGSTHGKRKRQLSF